MNAEKSFTPRSLLRGKTALAEGPYWHAASQCLYFTDIPAGRLWRLNPASSVAEIVYQGKEPIGGFTLQRDGTWLLFRRQDILRLDAAGGELASLPLSIAGAARCNDVIADPCGRVYFGTIGASATSGGLYCLHPCGRLECARQGTACANGMAFSPCRRYFYWTDTTARTIWRFRYDESSGSLRGGEIFYACPADEGLPDGLVVSADGRLWSARWGGASVVVISPAGGKLFSVSFPEMNITSLAWGGAALGDLYVTAARTEDGSAGTDLFVIENAGSGVPECRSDIFEVN